MGERPTARERIARLTSSFEEQDADLRSGDPLAFEGYGGQLEEAGKRSSGAEAAVWGWATIGSQACALVTFDFSFLGGSMGTVAGEKVARAFDAARGAGAPVACLTASGGARMQEGMWALVQMAKTVEAARRHAEAGLAQITVLCSPTTGGVYASFASLADVILAEPEATIGFAGPRVVEEMTGELPPPEVHRAEFALAHGLIDAIVAPEALASTLGTVLRALRKREAPEAAGSDNARERGQPHPPASRSAWENLQSVRTPSHPKGQELLDALVPQATMLRGDRTGAPDDEHVLAGVGSLAGTDLSAVVVAQNAVGDGRIRPQGFRKAVRAIEMAGRLGLPLVTLIDTRGADPLPPSEAGGVAAAIARTFEAMLSCPSPSVAVLTGEGGSGGALAMATADRVLAWESAVFSVIAPEGAAAILYRDASRAPELAERLRITTPGLVELGLVDVVIPQTVAALVQAVGDEVVRTAAQPPGERLLSRAERWRGAGGPG